jgi:4-diphosphocytidyl-2-C-methyl-D-erythritol kinase
MLMLQSPAKINLFLRLLYRRPDGYHELASLFQAIDLMDEIHFSLAKEDRLTCTDPTIPTDASNLILKAADLFRRKTGLTFGLQAHLVKKIPHQAGLGGGSGNAATAFWALNQLTGFKACTEDLRLWASEIGSDVAFFLSEGTAYCTGRGEILHPLPPLPKQTAWIIKPAKGTSTPAVYKKVDLSRVAPRDPQIALRKFIDGNPEYFNDLEMPAMEVMPELVPIKKKLSGLGFHTVLLSGSGSSFFCLGDPISRPHIHGCAVYKGSWINRTANSWYNASFG